MNTELCILMEYDILSIDGANSIPSEALKDVAKKISERNEDAFNAAREDGLLD